MPPVVAAVAAWAAANATLLIVASVVLSAGTAIYGAAQARKAERQARDAVNAGMKDRMITRIATEAPHRYIYGRAKVGSDVVAMFTSGDKDQFKHLVCVHAAHECDAIEEVYINNKPVGLTDGNGFATAGSFAAPPDTATEEEKLTGPTLAPRYRPIPGTFKVYSGTGASMTPVTLASSNDATGVYTINSSAQVTVVYDRPKWGELDASFKNGSIPGTPSSSVRVNTHLGGPDDPVDYYLHAVMGSKWPTTAVLRGMCYSVVTLDLNNPEFQGGLVPVHAIIRGKKLYDPRDGATRWTQNVALAMYDYLTSPLCAVPASDLPLSQFITAANVCDEVSPTGGARYTINGTVTSDQSQATVLESMTQAMAGGLVATTWDVYAGKYIAPVAALAQGDIVGSLSITPGVSDASIYNGVKGQYIGPENKYVQTDFTPYQNAVYRESDGRDLYTNIDFPFTESLQRVTNLARIFTEDQRNGYTIKAEFSLKAWPLKVGQRITFTSSMFGQNAKVFRITDKSFAPNSAVQLTLKEDDESIWDYADAVVVDSTPNSDLPDPWKLDPLQSIICTSGESTLLRQADGSTVPRILVSWPAISQVNGVQIDVEWRAVSSATWERTTVSASETQAYLSPITPGFFYVVRARVVNPSLNAKSNSIGTVYQVEVFTATPTVYMWAADKPAAPGGAASYQWSTGTFGAAPSGWSLTVPTAPAGGNVSLWAATVPVSDVSDVLSSFDWSQAEIASIGYAPATAGTGPAGYSNARVFAYQRKATAPTGTPGAVNYDFTTGKITTATLANGWMKDIPASDGNPLYVTSASASAAGTTDSIASTEWSGAVVMSYDGGAGTPGLNSATITLYQRSASSTSPAKPSAPVTYTFATGAVSGLNNGWNTYIPTTGGAYLHTTFATAIAATATDTIATTEWATVQLMYDATDLIAAKAAADAANSAVADMARDDLLSPVEKPSENLRWNSITGERAGIDAQAAALGITAERTAYTSAYNTLNTYITGLGSQFSTIPGEAVTIVGATYRSNFKSYYDAKQALLNKIAAVSAMAPSLNLGIARNLLSNSAPGSVAGYSLGYKSSGSFIGPTYIIPGSTPEDVYAPNKSSIRVYVGGAIAAENACDLHCGPMFSVMPSRRYEFSAALSMHRARGFVRLVFYDWNRQQIAFYDGTVVNDGQANVSTVPFHRSLGFITSPSNAAFALLLCTMITQNNDPYMFASQMYVGEALPSQTVGTQWVEGAPSDPRAIGYTGDLNASWGAPAGTNVGSTPATTVEANANGAANAILSTFTATLPSEGGYGVAPRVTATLGTFTPTITGGVGTVENSWSIESDGGGSIWISTDVRNRSATIRALMSTAGTSMTAYLTYRGTDQNKRVASATMKIMVDCS